MNEERYKEALKEKGITNADVQKELGISRVAFYRKRSGKTEFTLSELGVMIRIFSLETCQEIFLDLKVS